MRDLLNQFDTTKHLDKITINDEIFRRTIITLLVIIKHI